jgi:hypothetical protein
MDTWQSSALATETSVFSVMFGLPFNMRVS